MVNVTVLQNDVNLKVDCQTNTNTIMYRLATIYFCFVRKHRIPKERSKQRVLCVWSVCLIINKLVTVATTNMFNISIPIFYHLGCSLPCSKTKWIWMFFFCYRFIYSVLILVSRQIFAVWSCLYNWRYVSSYHRIRNV